MQFFGLKSCDTCKKALKALAGAGVTPQVTDVRADGVSRENLAEFLAEFGAALINRRSTTWRGLSDEDRAGDPLNLLADHPTLMKRPVIRDGDALYLGWDANTQAAVLPKA